MRATITLVTIYFYALLSSGTSSSDDDRRWLLSLVDLVELDYEDQCDMRATATWNELVGGSKELALKLERDKAFGIFARDQAAEVRASLTAHALASDDGLLRRKVKLLLQPGDMLLDTENWIKLITFGDTALNRMRFSTEYDCGTNTNCTLRELHNSLTRQQDEETLKRMKDSWERQLPDPTEYLEQILPLVRNASKDNNYNTVEEYWDFLGEYEGALLKARELWDNIKPLYVKLHKYVALRVKGADSVGKALPTTLFKSLTGDDWSNLIESLLPKHPDIYQKVHANLQLKNLGGINALKQADNLLKDLNIGPVDPHLWEDSVFNGSCPSIIVDRCKPNKVMVVSCKDVSLVNYIEAHEIVAKVKHKEIAALHSNNTYILREANRQSAVYEAIPGFVSLLSLNPHALNRAGLYPIKRFEFNPNHHRLLLQLISALRDLPRLNYYLAADEWRLKVLKETVTSSQIASSWSEFRKNFSLVENSNVDLLGDPYILFNKPFVGKFMGLILKYQVYQSFAEELISDEHDLINHVAENNDRLINIMMQGFGSLWPEMVSDLLARRENGLEYTGVTDYYRLLDEYLDNQLDPAADSNDAEEYVDPIEEPTPEENEIPTSQEKYEKEPETLTKTEKPSESHDLSDNTIDVGEDVPSKFTETSTVGVLEIKNPVANEDKNTVTPQEASYSTYWWIGIAVAVAIVLILIAIIAKKRQNHKKELEKQRRETSRA